MWVRPSESKSPIGAMCDADRAADPNISSKPDCWRHPWSIQRWRHRHCEWQCDAGSYAVESSLDAAAR
jgi:hypothetical protein